MTLRNLLIGTSVVLAMAQMVEASAPVESTAALLARARAARLAAAGHNASTSSTSQQVSPPAEDAATFLARVRALRAAGAQNSAAPAPAAPRPQTSTQHLPLVMLPSEGVLTLEQQRITVDEMLSQCREKMLHLRSAQASSGSQNGAEVGAALESLEALERRLSDTRAFIQSASGARNEKLAGINAFRPTMQAIMSELVEKMRTRNLTPVPLPVLRATIERAVANTRQFSGQHRQDVGSILDCLDLLMNDPSAQPIRVLMGLDIPLMMTAVWAEIEPNLAAFTSEQISGFISQVQQVLRLY